MAKFKIGDVCLGQNFHAYPEFNGVECEVLGVREQGGIYQHAFRRGLFVIVGPSYYVRWATTGKKYCVAERHLRKKQLPEEYLGSWEEIEQLTGWNPTRTKAAAA